MLNIMGYREFYSSGLTEGYMSLMYLLRASASGISLKAVLFLSSNFSPCMKLLEKYIILAGIRISSLNGVHLHSSAKAEHELAALLIKTSLLAASPEHRARPSSHALQ